MDPCASLFIAFCAALAAIKLYIKIINYHPNSCESHVCLVGKTAIITGAHIGGIGYETALDFAKRGAKVILACPDREKADEARSQIIEETQNSNISVRIVDFSSFGSVRAFAKDINTSEERLDILVNNAGAYELDETRSVDGHPVLMQINYFSPFLLTILLINLLKKSKLGRIVNVSSITARFPFDLDQNQIDRFLSNTYRNTKLCNILFTIELAKKLQGTAVTTYSLHPGMIRSNIFQNIRGVKKVFYYVALKLFAITCKEGAQTNIYCSIAKGIEKYSGEHFHSCQKVERYPSARDPELAKKLWQKTEEIVGLKRAENPF